MTLQMRNQEKFKIDQEFVRLAQVAAGNSPAKKRKVGAFVILENGDTQYGYNHMPDGFNISCENKNGDSFECVIHAEEHVIINGLKNNVNFNDATMYCTYSPCMNCCKLIVAAGIKNLIYLTEHKSNFTTPEIEEGISPKHYLTLSGVQVLHYPTIPKPIKSSVKKVAIIYHSKDCDGLMSGYLLRKRYFDTIINNNMEINMFPYNYEESAEWMDNDYDEYIFGDVTPTLGWIFTHYKKMESKEIKVIIFDHHQQRYDDICKNFDDALILIDYKFMSIWGACEIIDTNLFNSQYSMITQFISDYDTWKFANESYNPVRKEDVLAFNQYMIQFQNLSNFSNAIDHLIAVGNMEIDGKFKLENEFGFKLYIDKGKTLIQQVISKNLDDIKSGIWIGINFFYEGFPNYWMIEKLKIINPALQYMICYNINSSKQSIKFSVRSGNNSDCLLIANRFKGGGHRDAAGFTVPISEGCEIIKNPIKLFRL